MCVCPLVGIGTPFPPSSASPPPNQRKGEHIRLRVRELVHSPNSDDWRKSLLLCLLCAQDYVFLFPVSIHSLCSLFFITLNFVLKDSTMYIVLDTRKAHFLS
jgi:hypothetical protein